MVRYVTSWLNGVSTLIGNLLENVYYNMWPFKKKKTYVPYVPQGRVGYLRKELSVRDYEFTVIFEEIGQIGQRSKVRILEIDVDRDCNKSKEQCIKRWGIGDWLLTNNIHWETDEQRDIRLGEIPQRTYQIDSNEIEQDVIYRQPDERQLTRHNFINN
jgi:hypothetical protein